MTVKVPSKPSMFHKFIRTLIALSIATQAHAAQPGDTKILKWKDGKVAPFLLSFDDGCSSHLDTVIPALEKQGLVGNFYLNPGKELFSQKKAEWKKAANSPSVALQNHTFTHVGATSVAQLDEELAKCNESLKDLGPGGKWPRLIGFGQPGGVPWEISEDELNTLLTKHHLIFRPSFYGPPVHLKSAAECVASIDKALASGELGHLDMHGVNADWLVTPIEWFEAILSKLEKEKDRVWVTDVVSVHQYEKERESSKISALLKSNHEIRISLTCDLDPKFYDLPLTLATQVPSSWKTCTIKQGANLIEVSPKDGMLQYDAIPGSIEILITEKK